MTEQVTSDDNADPERAARAPRKSLFLAATIDAESVKAPVRIRNLSESGAMIEGLALPSQGTALVLQRGAIKMGANVVWQKHGRCGLTFDGVVSVDEWVAGHAGPRSNGQARVDTIQAAIRDGADVLDDDIKIDATGMPLTVLKQRVGDELLAVQHTLDHVATYLLDDPGLVERHGQALQTLDTAAQILGQLAKVLSASNSEAAAASVMMEDLRNRLFWPQP